MSTQLGYEFTNNRLSGLGFTVDSAGFDRALSALSKQYGKPHRTTRANGRDYAEWRFRDARLHLTRTGTLVVGELKTE